MLKHNPIPQECQTDWASHLNTLPQAQLHQEDSRHKHIYAELLSSKPWPRVKIFATFSFALLNIKSSKPTKTPPWRSERNLTSLVHAWNTRFQAQSLLQKDCHNKWLPSFHNAPRAAKSISSLHIQGTSHATIAAPPSTSPLNVLQPRVLCCCS